MPRRRAATFPTAQAPWRAAVYRPLNTSRREIRLLTVYPNTDLRNDPEGHVYTVSLDEANYAALSYVWGPPTPQRTMILNGWRIKIQENAHDALRYLRKRRHPVYIWIDALCINQTDDAEKSAQIPLMRDIFSKASPVYIWSGKGLEPALKTFDLAESLVVIMRRAPPGQVPTYQLNGRAVWDRIQHITPNEWRLILQFLDNPLWRRVWIVQEILLAAFAKHAGPMPVNRLQAVLVAGKRECRYHTHFILGLQGIFAAFIMFGQHDAGPPGTKSQLIRETALAAHTKVLLPFSMWQAAGDFSMELTMSIVHPLQAHDPHDLVYGLSGLMPYLCQTVDYTKPLATVYGEATWGLIQRWGSLAPIFGTCYHLRQPKHKIPSWAIDWTDKRSNNFNQRWVELAELYNACYGHAARATLDGKYLTIGARKLFEFTADILGPVTDFPNIAIRGHQRQLQFVLQQQGLDHNSSPEDVVAFIQRYTRVLLMDLDVHRPGSSHQRIPGPIISCMTPYLQTARAMIFNHAVGDALVEDDMYRLVKAALTHRLRYTRIAVSPTKQMCIIPEKTQIGDFVYILEGSTIPFVLRPVADVSRGEVFEVVGGAYVDGVMDGEMVADSAKRVSTGDPEAYDTAFSKQVWLV